jgi:hypothetical protein
MAAVTLLLGPASESLAQCAMCARSAEGSLVGRGLSISVLFLLGALTLVATWLVLVVVRSRTVSPADPQPVIPSTEAQSS